MDNNMNYEEFYLFKEMRRLFSEHTFYSRLYIILSTHNLDTQHIVTRSDQNTKDISDIFNHYYTDEDSDHIYFLLREHVTIECDIVDMMLKKNNKNSLFDQQSKTNMKDIISEKQKWYNNVVLLAIHLESMNPFLYGNITKELIFEHLDLMEQEIISTVNSTNLENKGDIEQLQLSKIEDIKSADLVHYQILEVADTLAEAIVRQFKHRFDNTSFNSLLPV